MTERYSEDEVIATVTRLTRLQLVGFIEGDLVQPERGEDGYVFRRVDIARLELLCDLSRIWSWTTPPWASFFRFWISCTQRGGTLRPWCARSMPFLRT